jgi:hypothetical protein
MSFADVVRVVGVAVALFGAFVTAPDGFRAILLDARAVGRASSSRVRNIVARIVPMLRRDQTIAPPGGHVSVSAGTATIAFTAAAGWVWVGDEPSADSIRLLRERTEDLNARLRELQTDHAARIDSLEKSLREQLNQQRETLDRHAREAVEREQRAVRLDQDGLPLIAAGIVLTGLPDPWLTPLVAGVLLALTASLIVLWVRRWHRRQTTRDRLTDNPA